MTPSEWDEAMRLLGRRYVCDITVQTVGDDPARTVRLLTGRGDLAEISWDELQALLASGLLTERRR